MSSEAASGVYRRVLVAFDGSEGSRRALRRAAALVRGTAAGVTVLSVDEHVPRYAPAVGMVVEDEQLREAHFSELRSQTLAVAREQGMEVETETVVGHAAQTIVAYARDNSYDLIVIGRSGHSGLWGALLGSTTARVVDHAPCDILVVY